jgi:hypothetical protein
VVGARGHPHEALAVRRVEIHALIVARKCRWVCKTL